MNSLRSDSADDSRTDRIRTLLFDLDGVLWNSNALHAETMANTCEEAGLRMPDYARLAGLSTPEAFVLVLAENGDPSGQSVPDLTARKRSLFQARIDQVPSDHEAFCEALDRAPAVSLALVTGASRATAEAYLRRVPASLFDLVITADDGLPSKPAPDVYRSAMSRLGSRPDECVVFEDSEAGLAAARSSGAHVAHITHAWGGSCDGKRCGSDWCAPTVVDALGLIWGAR